MYTTSFVDLPLEELLTRVQTLKHEGIRFVQMCAETTERGIDLLYTFYDETTQNALNLCVYGIDESSRVPSIQGLYFAAFSYENEAHDLYGVRFVNMKLQFGHLRAHDDHHARDEGRAREARQEEGCRRGKGRGCGKEGP